jgi:hypothetical protein
MSRRREGEPRPRRNGGCRMCGRKRKLPAKPRVSPRVYELEPFCSRACCERWFRIEVGAA